MKLEPTPIGTPIPPTDDLLEAVESPPKTPGVPAWLIPLGIGLLIGFLVVGLIATLFFIARENEWRERLNQRDVSTTREASIRRK